MEILGNAKSFNQGTRSGELAAAIKLLAQSNDPQLKNQSKPQTSMCLFLSR